MFLNLIYIVVLFFGIGALLTVILNKSSNPEQKDPGGLSIFFIY